MKIVSQAILFFAIAINSHADDTEIYGTAGNTAENSAKPNVIFIMDTSGSMNATVINRGIYNPATTYSGSYQSDHVYSSLSQSSSGGHIDTVLEQTSSTNCAGVITALSVNGKANGNFQQKRNGYWYDYLNNGNDSQVRCNAGNNIWLYTGNYMNWYINWSSNGGVNTGIDRLETVVNVVKNMTDALSDVNMGLMRFDRGSGGYDSGYGGGHVDVAVEDILTAKSKIKNKLDAYTHQGGTPLTEVMYEAARYYRGETPVFGNDSSPNDSVSSSKSGSRYNSPITAQCQKNHIILFTDGEPSVDGEVNDEVRDLIEDMDFSDYPNLDKNCSGDGGCLDELTHWLYQTDQSSEFTNNQPIITYTIGGFDLDSASLLLNSAATHGGGSFYQANNTGGLTSVLTEIFTEILAVDTTFTAPAVSVNAFNASEHRDDLFYALFRPENNVKWGGNLKRYKIQDGVVKAHVSNGATKTLSDAIDDETGYFHLDSFDLWNTTNTPDGKNVTNGGMAKILPETRTIYSDNNSGSLESFDDIASATTFNMSSSEFSSTLITDWVKGVDVQDADSDGDRQDRRLSIGDPLHSEPVIMTYGGSEDDPDSTIFFGTNEGFIHAVDTESGEEAFAFLPKELHDIQHTYYQNTASVSDKPYGMDGSLSIWFRDANNNNVLYETPGTLDANEHVYLYGGMRRGGRSYYALDVTDRNNPEMLFKITGGETTGFDRLGQTWAKMTVSRVMWDGTSRYVLFFSGGYDTNQDSNNTREDDDVGNAIYMVDASTGELLWTASKDSANLVITDMKNSIPASVSTVDISGDDHVNYLFAADTAGRIFRIDLNPENSGASDFARGGMIAQIGDNSQAGNRRFYNKPNISLIKDKQFGDYLTIAIGSGYRAHPLNTNVSDRFYMIKDFHPYGAPSSYSTTITEAPSSKTTVLTGETIDRSLLYNVTSVATSGSISNDLRTLLAYGAGWYIEMGDSEKVLSQSMTFAGTILFSTFSPVTSNQNASGCGANTGTARAYAISQKWGLPVFDLDGDGNNESNIELTHSGIAPRPVVIYGPGGRKTITVGTETIEPKSGCTEEPCDEEDDEEDEDDDDPLCTDNNCYVKPIYWRQNDNEQP